jgi:hypothetical protein
VGGVFSLLYFSLLTSYTDFQLNVYPGTRRKVCSGGGGGGGLNVNLVFCFGPRRTIINNGGVGGQAFYHRSGRVGGSRRC